MILAETRVAKAETVEIKALIVCKCFSQVGQIYHPVSTKKIFAIFAKARVTKAETVKIKTLIVCKYFPQFGWIHYLVSTNIISKFRRGKCRQGWYQDQDSHCCEERWAANTFHNLDKYIFLVATNVICNFDKGRDCQGKAQCSHMIVWRDVRKAEWQQGQCIFRHGCYLEVSYGPPSRWATYISASFWASSLVQ